MKTFYTVAVIIVLLLVKVFTSNKEIDRTFESSSVATGRSVSVTQKPDVLTLGESEKVNTQIRQQKLFELQELREKQTNARERMPALRQSIFESKETEWKQILHQHDKEYQQLRKQAELTEHNMVDCTICGGDTYLDYCLFCDEDSNGVCSECDGTGVYIVDDVCAPCLGSGKCFMCAGTKKMMCLFCQDGTIDLALPPYYQEIQLF